ncbi:MAG: glycosyltransferase, partial [Gammaproteobacteria bacterium]|nr:glycosyltransferase [Gammaproteobacteria bacterium]
MSNQIRIVHVIYRLATGGMENGLVNLVNRLGDGFEHHIISLTDATDFGKRIEHSNTTVHVLGKKPGKDFAVYWRLWKLLRKIRPQIVHTRNFGTVDCALIVRLAGRAKLIHSEHGWDMHDIKGANRRYLLLRRWMSLFACKCLSVSRHIRNWQREQIGVAPHKLVQIYNGVDHEKFKPADRCEHEHFVVGFVGRLEEVKNLPSLVRAVAHLGATTITSIGLQVRLVGSGSMESELRSAIVDAGLENCVILDGPRSDIPQVMREFDVFVLPSFNEGISNTILEAMASGLP